MTSSPSSKTVQWQDLSSHSCFCHAVSASCYLLFNSTDSMKSSIFIYSTLSHGAYICKIRISRSTLENTACSDNMLYHMPTCKNSSGILKILCTKHVVYIDFTTALTTLTLTTLTLTTLTLTTLTLTTLTGPSGPWKCQVYKARVPSLGSPWGIPGYRLGTSPWKLPRRPL